MSLRTIHVFALAATTAGLFVACGDDAAQTDPGTTSAATSGSGGEGGTGGQGGATSTTSSTGGGATTSSTAATTTTSTGSGGAPPVCDPFVTTGVVLAFNNVFVGETDPGGASSSTAWKQYGFDIDGLVSTAQSPGLCQVVNGAPASTHDDGNNGNDNSFGKNVLPLLLAASSDPTAQLNASIAAGEFTMMIHLKDLAAAPDQAAVTSNLYTGANRGLPPVFDGSDCWPTAAESLVDPTDIDTPKVTFPLAALSSDVWVSGVADSLDLTLFVLGFPLKLTLHKARLSLDLAADHASGVNGQVGGVLDAQEFIAAVKDVVAPNLGGCNSASWGAVEGQLKLAADIMVDGSQDPNATCNGVSIGLGFTAAKVDLGTVADPVPVIDDPCP
jgi:hypothetical protein